MLFQAVKISLIVNESKSKARKLANKFCALVNSTAHDVEIFGTERIGHAIDLAFSASKSSDLIVAIGGDGTINECVNGMMQGDKSCAFSVLSVGTGNDFARTFSFPSSPELLAKAIESPSFFASDVGLLEYEEDSEYFLNIADAGLGPTVLHRMMNQPSWLPSGLKFNAAIIRTLMGYKRPILSCRGEGFEWEGEALVVAVANGIYFANGLGVAPEAKLDSGEFEVFVAGGISILDYLQNIPKLKKAQRVDHPGLHYFRSSWLEISGPSSMEKDGELGGQLPCKVSCVPQVIRLLNV